MRYRLFFVAIALLGFGLRLIDYDRLPPFGETMDEFIYPWAGLTLLKSGVPQTWSPFISYPKQWDMLLWGKNFTMVFPFVEKPFLYSFISGAWVILWGAKDFADVRLDLIRLLPIFFNTLSIGLIILIGNNLFNRQIGLIAGAIYATMPFIVLGNRLSLTENLLIFLVVLALFVLVKFKNNQPLLLGLISGLAILTKQTGWALPSSLIIISLCEKNKRQALMIFLISGLFFAAQLALVWYLDPGLKIFFNVSRELRTAHALGLPEAIPTLFRFPGIGHKESIFLDGSLLLGLILLFAAPFLSFTNDQKLKTLAFPLTYLVFLVIGEGGQTWYGWHMFPLLPFTAMLLAWVFYDTYKNSDLGKLTVLSLVIGVSNIRFLLLIHPQFFLNWQLAVMFFLGVIFLIYQYFKNGARKKFLLFLFLIYLIMNIYTIFNLRAFYPLKSQPLSLRVQSVISRQNK